jgi:hypothetical protein
MKKIAVVLMMVMVSVAATIAKPMGPATRSVVEQAITSCEKRQTLCERVRNNAVIYTEWLQSVNLDKITKKADRKATENLKKNLTNELKYYITLAESDMKLQQKYVDGYNKALEENDIGFLYRPIATAEVELHEREIETEKKVRSLEYKFKAILEIYGILWASINR